MGFGMLAVQGQPIGVFKLIDIASTRRPEQ
jgi:hypothetical protein